MRYCGVCPPAAISWQDGPCRVHRRRNTTAVKRNAPELPILKQTLIPNDLLSRSRVPRGGHSHRSKMRFPQPSKAATSSPSGLFPAVPADSVELAAECSSVRNGRLGNDSADRAFACFHLDTWSVLALFKPAHLPVRRPLCQLVAAPCPRHRHFSHCHPQRRTLGNWWRRSDLNAQLPACKAGTLPLSYVPMCVWRVIERPFSVCRGGHCTWSAISRVSTPIVILREGTAPLTSVGSDPATIHSARLIPGCQRSLPAVTWFFVCTGLRALRAAAIRAGRFPHGLSRFRLVGPAGVAPTSAGFLWPCAQTVCPMRPSLRAVKRLSALPERRK